MQEIFSDFEIICLEKDKEPGILLKARKPSNWKPKELKNMELYSIILNKRVNFIPEKMAMSVKFKIRFRMIIYSIISKIKDKVDV